MAEDLTESTNPELSAPTAGAAASLHVKRGGAESGEVYELVSPAVVGRFDPSAGPIDVDLGSSPDGGYVSRKHAKIWLEDGTWKIQDLGSSNGTFLLRDDFERIDLADLHDGDEIALGNARFVFHSPDTSSSTEAVEEPPAEQGAEA